MNTFSLDKKISDGIKGLAVIFLFIHHFFTFPDWYIDGVAYPNLIMFAHYLREPFKICVPVFAFLTGYFYAQRPRTVRYSLRKITDILVSYWAVYIPLLVLALILGCYSFSTKGFLLELFALNRPVMFFCWYVYFYCLTMLLLPLLEKLAPGGAGRDSVIFVLLPVVGFTILLKLFPNGLAGEILNNMQFWIPPVAAGWLCARYGFLEKFPDAIAAKFRSAVGRAIFWLLLLAAAFLGRFACPRIYLGALPFLEEWVELSFNADLFYAPVFVYALARLLECIKDSRFNALLGELGRRSLLMWFVHCVFFNVCREKTQWLLYLPKNPVLVVLWGLLICYGLARLIDLPLKPLLRLKNRLFQEERLPEPQNH